jgi:hypothetical protein
VNGHHRDPLQPFSDAGMLASELPNARLVQASSLIELRTHPKRLTRTIASFINDCWHASLDLRELRQRLPEALSGQSQRCD